MKLEFHIVNKETMGRYKSRKTEHGMNSYRAEEKYYDHEHADEGR